MSDKTAMEQEWQKSKNEYDAVYSVVTGDYYVFGGLLESIVDKVVADHNFARDNREFV